MIVRCLLDTIEKTRGRYLNCSLTGGVAKSKLGFSAKLAAAFRFDLGCFRAP